MAHALIRRLYFRHWSLPLIGVAMMGAVGVCEGFSIALINAYLGSPARATFGIFGRIMNLDRITFQDDGAGCSL
jgi:hypothetical protein